MISPRPALPQLLRANHQCRLPPLLPTTTLRHYSTPNSRATQPETRRSAVKKLSDSQLKEKWLESMTCPFPLEVGGDVGLVGRDAAMESDWVVGVDPDVSGALALLKPDGSGCSAQVFDTPYLRVSVGKRSRKRPDVKSIVLLLQSLGAPLGTDAYIEQSTPFPKDGKQGWWSGGYTYGLWIGVLVASGFSVTPVTSRVWKDHFELCGGQLNKDDSRRKASLLFPSASPFLLRKKDHGRAEALLIAAYGKRLCVPESIEK